MTVDRIDAGRAQILRTFQSATAPATRGAANEVPDMRVTPPLPSETSSYSPGATMKRFISKPLCFR